MYEKVVWWLEASKKFGFNCKIRNYSKHKASILDIFFQDLLNGVGRFEVIKLKKGTVNRSLRLSEYKLQTEINRPVKRPSTYISNALTNELPSIKSETPIVSQTSYDAVRDQLSPIIENINKLISPHEEVMIEERTQFNSMSTKVDADKYTFSEGQIKVLAKAIVAHQRTPGTLFKMFRFFKGKLRIAAKFVLGRH